MAAPSRSPWIPASATTTSSTKSTQFIGIDPSPHCAAVALRTRPCRPGSLDPGRAGPEACGRDRRVARRRGGRRQRPHRRRPSPSTTPTTKPSRPRPAFPWPWYAPGCTAEVSAVLKVADELHVPVTARGSGTGLSGAAISPADGIVVSFERMNAILEIDLDNHVAVVATRRHPGGARRAPSPSTGSSTRCSPARSSASLGGNVATNAGGMRAIKYGVTRHHVLGLEAVLGHRRGDPDRRQVREDLDRLRPHPAASWAPRAPSRWSPRPPSSSTPGWRTRATVLAPFATLDEVTAAVPPDRGQRDRARSSSSTST